MSRFHFSMLGLLVLWASCATIQAQEVKVPDQAAPPPLKIVSRHDRLVLDSAKDSKARVRSALELADQHLANAEAKTTQASFDEAAAEAGQYRAIIEDLFTYLATLKKDSNKTRDLYKRVELTLRSEGPRLSIMRRTTPAAHAIWIKDIEEFARHGRTEALNSFYGHTVVRDRPEDKAGAAQLNTTPPKKP